MTVVICSAGTICAEPSAKAPIAVAAKTPFPGSRSRPPKHKRIRKPRRRGGSCVPRRKIEGKNSDLMATQCFFHLSEQINSDTSTSLYKYLRDTVKWEAGIRTHKVGVCTITGRV